MKILKTYLEEAIALVRSPGRTFTEMTSDYGYRISIQRTFFFIFVSFLFSELFSVKSTLLFFFLGGSVIDFLFRSLVPSILWTVFYSSVYTILFLASGTGVFYMIAKYSSGLSDLLRITTYVSRLSFLTTLVAMLNAVFASGWFGVLSIILFFLIVRI